MVRRLLGCLTLVALLWPALSVATAGAAAAAPAGAPAVGAQFQGMWSDWTDAQRLTVLDQLAASGATWVRMDVGWISMEEAGRGQVSQWYLNLMDQVVGEARARGLRVLATLWATPTWANGNQARNVPPIDNNDFAWFAKFMAGHFAGRVAAWEIWNEPNQSDFWSTRDAAQYTRLLQAAYPAVKAGDPSALVVLGGPSMNDTTWLSSVYAAGAKGSFDVLATHPYMQPADLPPETPDTGTIVTLTHVGAVRSLMSRYGDTSPIWFTEFGWSTHANTASTAAWDRGVTYDQQADYLVRTLELVASSYPYVTNVFWYMARDHNDGDLQQDNYGLLTYDLQPKPALAALRSYLGSTSTATSPSIVPAAPAPAPVASSSSSSSSGGLTAASAPSGATSSSGYRMVATDGGIFSFGDAGFFGSTGAIRLNQPIVGMAATPSGQGYWLVARDGGIFSFGDAGFFGSTGNIHLNQPIVGMASTPSGQGYWLVATDGGIFAFGDAAFFGSTGAIRLNQPIAAMAATGDGSGYWMVAQDGGLFSFGSAGFFGSAAGHRVVGMASTPDGNGYWLAGADGSVYAFGDAPFLGGGLGRPVAGIAAARDGHGYWLAGVDGSVAAFGSAPMKGSTAGVPLAHPVVGVASA